jgi:hypothetical protein
MSRTTSGRPDVEPEKAAESEGALRRWSRRKHEARVAAQREPAALDPAKAQVPAPSEKSSERIPTDADMPPLETLDESSDYSPFMSPGVSDALRQAALRRLFRSPQMNVLCELEGEFYDTRGLTPLGNIVTYDMRAALEREMEKAKSDAKEKIRDDLTDAKASDGATEASAKPSPPSDDADDAETAVAVARGDAKPSNDRGAE